MSQKNYCELNELAFDLLSKEYKLRKEIRREDFEKITKQFMKYLLMNFSNPKILEIGPGAGVTLQIFEKQGIKTTAIDLSLKMIDVAKEVSPQTKFIGGDFLEYNFGFEKFSGIFARQVIHLFPQNKIYNFLEKTYSLLEKRGGLCLFTPLFDKSKEEYLRRNVEGNEFVQYRRRYTEKELWEIINNTKFIEYQRTNEWKNDSKGNAIFTLELLLKK